MPTYESIKYKISGTAITGVLQESTNLSDVANATTARDNLGVEIGGTPAAGADVQAFISTTAGTNANGSRTVSTNNPSGGSDGDIWYKYT
tara:strand:- start:72 stop:341 length:270 start_codon:yes stop_codon:yes gene_type:complete